MRCLHVVGPAGFLCCKQDKSPGNAGVKDVVLALRWVRDNINAFNGNPHRVVVGGQGFGAAMVEALTLSEAARGLYHGVIQQSGSVLAPWAFNYDAADRANYLRTMLNPTETELTNYPVTELVTLSEHMDIPYYPFGMCLERSLKGEESILPEAPSDMLRKGKVSPVARIMGFTNNEAYPFVSALMDANVVKRMMRDMMLLLPEEFRDLNDREMKGIINDIKQMYFKDNSTMESETYNRNERDAAAEAYEHVVQTEYGEVRGYLREGTGMLQFFDIPYGHFNIEDPFQEPIPPQPWQNEINNKEHTSICPQINEDGTIVGTSNCLTLSIFAQNRVVQADVLFHIHRGDFKYGSGDPDIYQPDSLVSNEIIVVLPNYRLGPLGYLCLQNDTAPGNAALKDLALALNWTKHNIENFGGNSSNIVVSGAGSAGALVDYLVASSQSKDYISKAITESGFALSHWAIDREPLRTVEELSTFTITGNVESILTSLSDFEPKPCVELNDGFINETFWNILNNSVSGIPYMLGSASQAGIHLLPDNIEESIIKINENFPSFLPNDLIFEEDEVTKMANRIKVQYFGEKDITESELENLSLYLTDSAYLSPGIRQARLLAKAGFNVFFYEFAFAGPSASLISSADKGSTIKYIFNNISSTLTSERTSREDYIRNLLINLWVSFIKTGIPSAENVVWHKWGSQAGKEESLKIGSDVKLVDEIHADRLKLWDEIYHRHFIDNPSSASPISPLVCLALFNVLVNYAPEAPPRWDGIFEATYQIKCPQPDGSGTEDCLVVNVFVPDRNLQLAPVLFYPSHHVIDQGVIIITFNHRIGASGFLCLRTPHIPGNVGLKDQIAALYWIQRNIGSFNGNPNDIAAYGTGSGAVAIQLLMLSEAAAVLGGDGGLFQKAILESGSVLSPSAFTYDPIGDAYIVAAELGFTTQNIEKLEIFFENLSIRKLVKKSTPILPCFEGTSLTSLISKDPLDAMKHGSLLHIPMMIVYSSAQQVEIIRRDKSRFSTPPDKLLDLIPNNLDIDNLNVRLKISQIIKDFYFGDNESRETIVINYISYTNDVFLVYPIVKSAGYFAYKNVFPVFLMEFTKGLCDEITHDVIYQMLFNNSLLIEDKTAETLKMMWSNFLILGDPTPITTATIPDVWLPLTVISNVDEEVDFGQIVYLQYGKRLENKKLNTHQFKFWDYIYNYFYKKLIN
ncbi:unnamed protein product, partial [Leptidea sinapis]